MANESMGLVGRKIGMTQIFDEDGTVNAVTVVETGPCTVVQIKTTDTADGYNALQLGFGSQKEQRSTKAEIGHAKKAGAALPRVLREIRVSSDEVSKHEVGKAIGAADVFSVGDLADVIGTSKGRGFAGVFKKFNFKGFIRSHGTHEFFRHGGSIGTRLTPGRVFPGRKMPGQYGNSRTTVQNLKVVKVDAERNLVFLKGGIPGPNGGTVVVRHAVK